MRFVGVVWVRVGKGRWQVFKKKLNGVSNRKNKVKILFLVYL
jgi:hypothetical protein